jgi:hypothetical protein
MGLLILFLWIGMGAMAFYANDPNGPEAISEMISISSNPLTMFGGITALMLLAIFWGWLKETLQKRKTTAQLHTPTAKKTAIIGKCQDCGCELIDTEATFCEDCQLAVFMANDEDVPLAQVLGDE